MTHSPEVDKLARTLKNSRVAVSESEAYRMAEEMLSIGKKVSDDFKQRDEKIYGQHRQDSEMKTAQKMVEKISQNMGAGKSDGRVDIQQLDLGKPLKQLVEEQEEPIYEDEDDAVLIKDNNSPSHVPEPALFSSESTEKIVERPVTNITQGIEEMPEHFGKAVSEPEKIQISSEDEDLFDDDEDDKDTEEEHEDHEVVAEEVEAPKEAAIQAEIVVSEEETRTNDVDVKEIYF